MITEEDGVVILRHQRKTSWNEWVTDWAGKDMEDFNRNKEGIWGGHDAERRDEEDEVGRGVGCEHISLFAAQS